MTRWDIDVPDKTDLAVRRYLARSGGRTGDLSEFVNEAVRRHIFDLTVSQIKNRNATYNQEEILDLIDEEVDAARADCS